MRALAIVNAAAPRLSQGVLSELHETLGARHLYLTASAEEAREVLAEALTGEPLALLSGGGDGTLTSVLSAATDLSRERGLEMPAIGLLPLGTGNAFARYAATEPAGELVAAARAGRVRRQLGTVAAAGQVGLFCGFGVDAQIIADHAEVAAHLAQRGLAALGRGPLGYALSVAARSLPGFARRRRPVVRGVNGGSPAVPLDRGGPQGEVLASGAELFRGPLTLAACASIREFGFGLEMFAHGDRRADRFQVRLSDAGLLEILANTRAAFRGEYFSENTHDFLCDAVDLELDIAAPFEIGGELAGRFESVRVESGPTLAIV